IKVKEGETVPVNSVVAVIGTTGDAKEGAGGAVPQAAAGQPEVASSRRAKTDDDSLAEGDDDSLEDAHEEISKEDLRRQRSSPLVRRIAKEHNVDISLIKGTGISGRVTKQDILGFIKAGGARQAAAPRREAAAPAFAPGENVKVVPMSVMRRKIA